MMIPTPEPAEVNRLATEALKLRKDEGITLLEAIETVCNLSLVPATDKPLKIGNVKAYEPLLQDAVINEVVRKFEEGWQAEQQQSNAERNRANARVLPKPAR